MALALAACSSGDPRPERRPLASVTDPNALKPESSVEGEKPAPPQGPATATTNQPRALQPLKMDTSKKLEIVDVYVNTRDPNGMRKLVPYLLRQDEWMILKVQYTSPTMKHYRFQRVAPSKESLPMPDPLRPKNST